MDQNYSNTYQENRKYRSHLTLDERGMIQVLHEQGFSLRKIAAIVGCAHTTVSYELKRGTPLRKGIRGRKPKYSAKYGQKQYQENRKNSKRKLKIKSTDCEPFIQWMTDKVRKDKWSIDNCVGYAKKQMLFPVEIIPSTRTLYNMLWQRELPLTLFDVPQVLGRKKCSPTNRRNKRILGKSIDERPDIVAENSEFGHWEIDTVIGRRNGKEAVIFTAVEKLTRNYIAIRISGRSSNGVEEAMQQLRDLYGERYFRHVFKTMTADNGPEFASLSSFESLGTQIYFTHPYSSWERAQNERHNGLLRKYIPKGKSIESYSDDDILNIADAINLRPRRILGYYCPAELFDHYLDQVYSMDIYS